MKLRVTVCELPDYPDEFNRHWEELVGHVKAESSQLVLLPEVPFSSWFTRTKQFDPAVWQDGIKTHDSWQSRLGELAPAMVLGTRPVDKNGRRLNEGFVWNQAQGYSAAHQKFYLPDEEGFWEASWYHRGNGDFNRIEMDGMRIGFLICTELWFLERARAYGREGVHLITIPRTTGKLSVEKWLLAGRTAAIVAGAFVLSSNRTSPEGRFAEFGGQGWIVSPDGEVLGLTSNRSPFVTVEVDLSEADEAKKTYPRYVVG